MTNHRADSRQGMVTRVRLPRSTYMRRPDGRMSAANPRRPSRPTAIGDVWAEARTHAPTPKPLASPLAGRPYYQRRCRQFPAAHVGVPPPEVAERAGNSVEMLLRISANCPDDAEHLASPRAARRTAYPGCPVTACDIVLYAFLPITSVRWTS
jgi:hypothetical protein